MFKIIYVFLLSIVITHYNCKTQKTDKISESISTPFRNGRKLLETVLTISNEKNEVLDENSSYMLASSRNDSMKTKIGLNSVQNRINGSQRKQNRIINGNVAERGQFPYQVGIIVKQRNQEQFLCGGSILNESFVITAAHCNAGDYEYYVIAGDVDRHSKRMKRFGIKQFLVRPDYNKINQQGDIALIEIDGKFWKENHTKYIAPIPLIDYAIKDKTKCFVSGWGYTRSGGQPSQHLLWVELTLMSRIWCMLRNFHWLTGMICLESTDESRQAVCNGDSGGPAAVDGKLAGVVSWGKGKCEDMTNPNVFTDVHHYRNWILYNKSSTINPSIPTIVVTIVLKIVLYFYFDTRTITTC